MRERGLLESCGESDLALREVARELAQERARGAGMADPDETLLRLRRVGEPHVAPRVYLASGRGAEVGDALKAQLTNVPTSPSSVEPRKADSPDRHRCGIAFADVPHGGEVAVAVRVEALADLDALPVNARVGQWLTLSALVHVPVVAAKVIVLGPRGLPRSIPTTLDTRTGRVVAKFTLPAPGAYVAQIMGTIDGGPRPLLEARIFADEAPPEALSESPVPGEDVVDAAQAAVDELALLVASLRRAEGLPPLRRDATLDRLAKAHADSMRASEKVAHDVGQGDLQVRFERAGEQGRIIGENVARSSSVRRAHRALFASASHRLNLLRADYTHVGFGIAEDAGVLYACEVFVGE